MVIIDENSVPGRLFLARGEYLVLNQTIVYNKAERIITNERQSFVKDIKFDTFLTNNQVQGNSIISQEWFYTTFPDQRKMAKHTFTLSTYSDNTFSKKIGEITFSSNLFDYGTDGNIVANQSTDIPFGGVDISTLFVQSAYGIYDKIHKIVMVNFDFFGAYIIYFVKKY
jgi:hypothetical protein